MFGKKYRRKIKTTSVCVCVRGTELENVSERGGANNLLLVYIP